MMPWAYGWGSGMALGWILMAIFWILVILGIIYVVKFTWGGQERRQYPRESALDILKRRYASGEISKEEFEQMKKDIT